MITVRYASKERIRSEELLPPDEVIGWYKDDGLDGPACGAYGCMEGMAFVRLEVHVPKDMRTVLDDEPDKLVIVDVFPVDQHELNEDPPYMFQFLSWTAPGWIPEHMVDPILGLAQRMAPAIQKFLGDHEDEIVEQLDATKWQGY